MAVKDDEDGLVRGTGATLVGTWGGVVTGGAPLLVVCTGATGIAGVVAVSRRFSIGCWCLEAARAGALVGFAFPSDLGCLVDLAAFEPLIDFGLWASCLCLLERCAVEFLGPFLWLIP